MAVAECLAALEEAVIAAEALGLDVADARQAADDARRRLGFPGDVYVVAFVGGTGVGKSSLLNVLAGTSVSPASVRRPTTADPVAWVPSRQRPELADLLAWLRVGQVVEHHADALGSVAVLDLPDIDSIEPGHRRRVDELLPRVDAVVWVSDPEKYADALFHDEYLRRWGGRTGRQVFLLNKADRVPEGERSRLLDDVRGRLRAAGLRDIDVLPTSATGGAAGTGRLRAWLEEGVEAKAVIRARVAREIRAAVRALADAAGVEAAESPGTASGAASRPTTLLPPERRRKAAEQVVRAALRVVDLPGLERQAIGATRHAARPRGGGPVGLLIALGERAVGREQRVADPDGYLRRWRTRGSLLPAIEPVQRLVTESLPVLPPGARPPVVAAIDGRQLQARVAEAIDRAVTSRDVVQPVPRSLLWAPLGLVQYVATGALALGAVWLLVLWLGGAVPVTMTSVPVLGPVPTPALLLFAGLVAGFVLARVLGFHATFLGRRWARRLRLAVTREVETQLDAAAFGPLARIDETRARLAGAVARAERECANG